MFERAKKFVKRNIPLSYGDVDHKSEEQQAKNSRVLEEKSADFTALLGAKTMAEFRDALKRIGKNGLLGKNTLTFREVKLGSFSGEMKRKYALDVHYSKLFGILESAGKGINYNEKKITLPGGNLVWYFSGSPVADSIVAKYVALKEGNVAQVHMAEAKSNFDRRNGDTVVRNEIEKLGDNVVLSEVVKAVEEYAKSIKDKTVGNLASSVTTSIAKRFEENIGDEKKTESFIDNQFGESGIATVLKEKVQKARENEKKDLEEKRGIVFGQMLGPDLISGIGHLQATKRVLYAHSPQNNGFVRMELLDNALDSASKSVPQKPLLPGQVVTSPFNNFSLTLQNPGNNNPGQPPSVAFSDLCNWVDSIISTLSDESKFTDPRLRTGPVELKKVLGSMINTEKRDFPDGQGGMVNEIPLRYWLKRVFQMRNSSFVNGSKTDFPFLEDCVKDENLRKIFRSLFAYISFVANAKGQPVQGIVPAAPGATVERKVKVKSVPTYQPGKDFHDPLFTNKSDNTWKATITCEIIEPTLAPPYFRERKDVKFIGYGKTHDEAKLNAEQKIDYGIES